MNNQEWWKLLRLFYKIYIYFINPDLKMSL